jgi:hypothetical protein
MSECHLLPDRFFNSIAAHDFSKLIIEFLDTIGGHVLSFPPAACGKAPLAQLDRASDYESEGREFESLRVYFFFSILVVDCACGI